MIPTEKSEQLEFQEVTPENWHDLERLFESRGGPRDCWCMVFRAKPANSSPVLKKSLLKQQVDRHAPIGILGYIDGIPSAWCSIAPRETFVHLGGMAYEGEVVWSLVCFFIPRKLRGQGFARKMIRAAVDHARRKGATIVEAYPVDPDSPSYRFMGFVNLFKSAGFQEVGLSGSRRHVMNLRLG